MTGKYRTHSCAELNESNLNKKIILSGWLHRKRDHGNLLFIDLEGSLRNYSVRNRE